MRSKGSTKVVEMAATRHQLVAKPTYKASKKSEDVFSLHRPVQAVVAKPPSAQLGQAS